MLDTASQTRPPADNSNRWKRDTAVAQLCDFESVQQQGISQRQFARDQQIPRTTLQGWRARKHAIEAPTALVDFFESPEGLALLHRMTLAAHLVMTLMGNCGIRLVSRFFELAGLTPFLANSYGAQHALNAQVHRQVRDFGAHQRQQLATKMPHRKVALCADETFPTGGLCLVAIEPVSNFILLESYEEKRDVDTWNRVIDDGIDGLNLTIESLSTDQAAALKKLARDREAARSPDLFHVQHDVNKACVLPLWNQQTAAHHTLETASAALAGQRQNREDYDAGPRPRGRRPHFETRIACAQAAEVAAQVQFQQVAQWRAQRADAVAGLARSYHPYDLETGVCRPCAVVETELTEHLQAVKAMAVAARLSKTARERLEKAERVLPEMVTYLSWFHGAVEQRLDGAAVSAAERGWLSESLVPGAYLRGAASRAPTAERKAAITEASQRCLASVSAPDSGWWQLPLARRERLEGLAWECAALFQRSSSCVEGRNGQLALYDHSTRGLSPEKLEALTVIHNYVARRPDGTTAAERFFGTAPDDLFQWLVERIPVPTRPAKRRARSHKTTLVEASQRTDWPKR